MEGCAEGLIIREHAHRAANDLAVATAALRLAGRSVGADPLISTAIARLEATSRVQRLLCEAPARSDVDVAAVLSDMCGAMRLAHAGPPASVEVVAPSIRVDGRRAWLLTLCVHELVRNALRHGGRAGADVRVEVDDDGTVAAVVVSDRGPPRDWTRPGGQGATIVDELAARLGGEVARRSEVGGGRVTLTLPSLAATSPALAEMA